MPGVAALFGLVRPADRSRTTDTRSADLADGAKVGFLKNYLALPSDVEAAEFHVWYQDNDTGWVPGPSDCDIRAVLRVPRD